MSARHGRPGEQPALLENPAAWLHAFLWLFLLSGSLWLAGILLP